MKITTKLEAKRRYGGVKMMKHLDSYELLQRVSVDIPAVSCAVMEGKVLSRSLSRCPSRPIEFFENRSRAKLLFHSNSRAGKMLFAYSQS